MSRLLLQWLNEEVKLSQTVTSFEEDFKDGYLLAELLSRYNQQDNFHMIEREFTPDARIKNYCLVEPTVRRLGLEFNFKLAFDIMNGKKGVVMALLSEMRFVLDRIKKSSMPPIAPVGQRGQIMRVMNPGSERFDKSMSMAFEKAVRVEMDNPTEVLLHKTVGARFEAIGAASDAWATEASGMDAWEADNEKTRKREIFEHRKKHEGEFAKAWDLMNVEQWKKNQGVGRTRKLKDEKEVTDYQMRKTAHFGGINSDAKAQTMASIDAFDKRLESEVFREDPDMAATLGSSLKKTVKGSEGSGLPTLEYADQQYLDAGLNLALKTMKEHHEDVLQKQVVHDRRRRKFVRERERAHSDAIHNHAQAEIVKQLLNECKVEVQENTQRTAVLSQRRIMTENRERREELVQQVEADVKDTLMNKNSMVTEREKSWVVAAQEKSVVARAQQLETAKNSAAHQRSLEFIGDTVDRLLDLTDWVVTCRQVGLYHIPVTLPPKLDEEGNSTPAVAEGEAQAEGETETDEHDLPVPGSLWRDAKEIFVSALDMPESIMKPFNTNVHDVLPNSLSEQPMCVDLSWLLSASFQTHIAMAPVGSLEAAVQELTANMAKEAAEKEAKAAADAESAVSPEGETETKETEAAEPVDVDAGSDESKEAVSAPAGLVVLSAHGVSVPAERIVATHLATVDAAGYIESVTKAKIEGFNAIADGVEVPVENKEMDTAAEGFKAGLVVTPDWLFKTPPKHLLGEILIAASCAANPVPADPTPSRITVPPLPLRAAICGVSDTERLALSMQLKQKIPDLAIINSEKLVYAASLRAAEAASIAEEERTDSQKLALLVQENLHSGNPMSDELYVDLMVEAIQAALPPLEPVLSERDARDQRLLDADKTENALAAEAAAKEQSALEKASKYPGFLLEDFPNTRQQSVLLLQALSGIDYEQEKPKPADRASEFAAAQPETYDIQRFDPSKCGLNKVIYLDRGRLLSLAEERVRNRTDLLTGEVVQISDQTESIATLQDLYTPLRPVQMAAVDHAMSGAEKDGIRTFFEGLGLLTSYGVSDWEGDFSTVDEATKAVVDDIGSLTGLFGSDVEVKEGEQMATEDVEVMAEAKECESEGERKSKEGEEGAPAPAEEASTEDKAVEGEGTEEEPVPVVVMSTPTQGILDQPVAAYLVGMWTGCEQHSVHVTQSYFAALRDIRYQMVQRRRTTHDVVYRYLVSQDDRQTVYERFRGGFNAMSAAMRFDADVIAELYLRAIELGRALWSRCDGRKVKAKEILKGVEMDGVIALHMHRTRAEAAALIQAEFRRFLVSLHVLFDFTRGTCTFDGMKQVKNALEECLEAVVPVPGEAAAGDPKGKDAKKDAKGGGKKGEVASAVPFREVVPPVLLPAHLMEELPGPKVEEEEDPKAKKGKAPAKGKKGEEEVEENPLEIMVKSVIDAIATWTKDGGFSVQRAVYPEQEALCVALENAVWYEAARLTYSVQQVKAHVLAEISYLEDSEAKMVKIVSDLVDARHAREQAQVMRLVHMVGEKVEAAEPIRELWLLSQDSIAVHRDQVVKQYPPAPVVPQIEAFDDHRLNTGQIGEVRNWLSSIKTGAVVLEQDVLAMLRRAVGTAGTNGVCETTISSFQDGPRVVVPGGANKVTVKLLNCKDLPNADDVSLSDPYVSIRLGPEVEVSEKIQNNLNPEYNADFQFSWDGDADLELSIMDHDQHKEHELIGEGSVIMEHVLEQLLAGETVSQSVQLEYLDAKKGVCNVEITLPVPQERVLKNTRTQAFALPLAWRNVAVFDRLVSTIFPKVGVAGLDETVGHVDAEQLLEALTNFDSSSM